MATEFITTDQTAAYTVDSGDEVFLLEGVTMTSTHNVFSSSGVFDNTQLFIDGKIYASNDVFDISTGHSDVGILVGANASIMTGGDGFLLGGTGIQFSNAGFIHVDEAVFYTTDGDIEIFNSGTLLSNGETSQGPIILNGTGSINNTGLIQSLGDQGTVKTIKLFDDATVFNSGTIVADSGTAISIERSANTEITNSGLIQGAIAAFQGHLGPDVVINSGRMIGDVNLGSGNDTFDGRGGTVTGTVSGGNGDDTFIVDGRGTDLHEAIGQGTDHVQSTGSFSLGDNFENLTLIGEADSAGRGNALANGITGNSGDNRLIGYEGTDTLDGARGDDRLRGGRDADSLDGGRGRDVLFGGHGDDALDGGNGRDVLVGGLGADTLTGGDGADLFLFDRKAQSTRTEFDTIADFEQGVDRIDLSDVIEPRFKLVAGGFSGNRPEIKLKEVGADTHILITIDANRSVDMRIDVTGVTGLHADDFIL